MAFGLRQSRLGVNEIVHQQLVFPHAPDTAKAPCRRQNKGLRSLGAYVEALSDVHTAAKQSQPGKEAPQGADLWSRLRNYPVNGARQVAAGSGGSTGTQQEAIQQQSLV